MIDGMYQAGTDAALDDQVARPAPFKAPEPSLTFGQLAKAPFQGIASGSTKTAAFAADILGAFGDVAGSGGFNGGGMFATATPEERKQQEAARQKWINSGPDFSNPVGDELRQRAKDVMPDPTQTHAATQIVAGISEFATQAVTYGVAAGPLAPALLAGDVGFAEASKLKQEGVSLGARTGAAAVAGVAAGVSIALPVVGTGIKSTAALVAAGGPGTFIAQNAAERAILDNAGYSKIASQYDPLDPVGLALSTIVPAAFGGVALRARAKAPVTLKEVVLGIESNNTRYGKDGKILEGPMTRLGTAKGEMQVVDSTNLDPGYGVRPAADNSPAERARVGSDYLDAMLKKFGSEDKAMAAYNAGPDTLSKAIAKGGPDDWLRHMPAETRKYVAKGMEKLGAGRTTEAARATIARDPEAVAAARVNQVAEHVDYSRLTPDNDLAGMSRHQDAVERAHEQLARGEQVRIDDIAPLRPTETPDFGNWFAGSRAARDGAPQVVYHGTPAAFDNFKAGSDEPIYFTSDADLASRYATDRQTMGQRLSDNPDAGPNVRPSYLALKNPLEVDGAGKNYLDVTNEAISRAQREGNDGVIVRNVVDQPDGAAGKASDVFVAFKPDQVRSAISRMDRYDEWAKSASKAIDQMQAAKQPPPSRRATGSEMLAAAGESKIKPEPPKPAGAGTEAKSPDAAALDSQTAEIDQNMMVQLEGMDKPMSVADLMERVKQEADELKQDASFVEIAARCFLRNN